MRAQHASAAGKRTMRAQHSMQTRLSANNGSPRDVMVGVCPQQILTSSCVLHRSGANESSVPSYRRKQTSGGSEGSARWSRPSVTAVRDRSLPV